MRKLSWIVPAALALAALAAQLNAGGLLTVLLGNPDASPEAHAMGAVVTAKLAGCYRPEAAKLSASAIGVVHGRRQTIELKLSALKEPGFYAVTRQWPDEGKWVLQFVADSNGMLGSTLVAVTANGVDRKTMRQAMRAPSSEDVEALLQSIPEVTARR
jgi:hypothetical protein